MKNVFVVLFLAVSMFAQSKPQGRATADTLDGCGPKDSTFNVKADKNQHPTRKLEAGKALVYVFEQEQWDERTANLARPTIRVGVDGSWIGANRGNSYFFFPLEPGDHHVCANWQSSVGMYSKLRATRLFKAEAGQVYYFRVHVDERDMHHPMVKMRRLESDEGEALIKDSAFSRFEAKK